MKNLKKFKLVLTLGGLILFSTSCSDEPVGESKPQTQEVSNPEMPEVGKIEDGYAYPSPGVYSDKFNYSHNGVKLTDKHEIEKMLKITIYAHHDEDNIELALNETEKKNIELKLDQESEDRNANKKAYYSRGHVYHAIWGSGQTYFGYDTRNYGQYYPSKLKFGNLNPFNRLVILYYMHYTTGAGWRPYNYTYTVDTKRTLYLAFNNNNVRPYSHVIL